MRCSKKRWTHRYRNSGYIRVKVGTKRPYEHRLVMEKIVRRPLKRKEVVHHINHNRSDNRPENLKLFSSAGEHVFTEHIDFVDGRFRKKGKR